MRITRAGPSPARTFVKLGAAAAALLFAAAPLPAIGPSPAAAAAAFAADPRASGSIADFYRARGGRPLWLSPTSGAAAQILVSHLSTSAIDGVGRDRYRARRLAGALRDARRGDPRAVMRAEQMLSQAFVAYARELRRPVNVGMIYVDPELAPRAPSPQALLQSAAAAPSLQEYAQSMGWMHPTYAQLRRALLQRNYSNEVQRRLLALNLERARVLPATTNRYVMVNAAAQRLFMYENGQVVDYMRVVVGRPKHPTPMMAALIRFTSLNPYWNVPSDLAAERIAPNVVKGGTSYLKKKGYQLLSDWSDNPRLLNPASVDWRAVAAGRKDVRLRQLPGPGNSMGRMKFMFPNKEGIYLHDTPNDELFGEASRLFSGGCIRLEDAPRLGRWLHGAPLRPKGARPEQQVPLPTPVPVYITYLTAVPSGSSIAYYEDIYGRDRMGLPGRRGRFA
jgi:murein L,D-transpeptidase YcbB/YkuD